MQYSTAISDAVLALSAFYGAFLVFRRVVDDGTRWAGVFGFFLVGLAAALGTIRFGFAPGVKPAHSFCAGLAAMVGMPLMGAAFVNSILEKISGRGMQLLTGVLLAAAVAANLLDLRILRVVLGGLGTLAILVSAVIYLKADARSGPAALAGAALVLIAGLVIKTKGAWLGVLRVDWYHYTLAIAYLLLAFALTRYVNRRSA